MGMLDDVKYWSFSNVAFAVRVQQTDWEQWFEEVTISTTEPVLDSSDTYTDIGGKQSQPMTLRCEFETAIERQSFNSFLGTVGVIISPGGDSHMVLMDRARKIGSGTQDRYTLDVVFRPV